MTMRSILATGFALFVITSAGFGSGQSGSQDSEKMMAAMQAAMNPGELHQRLNPLIGNFQVSTKMWMEPGQPAVEGSGTCQNSWVLGQRFVEQRVEGNFMGMPFEGIGYTGYDNIQKKYVSTWIDSMGTGFMIGEGAFKTDQTIEFQAQYPDPTSEGMLKFREELRIEDENRHAFVMYMIGADGKEFRNMEILYTRKP